MNKLSPEKRNHLILVAVGTLAAIFVLWYFVIKNQQTALIEARKKTADAKQKVDLAESAIKRADEIETEMNAKEGELAAIESGMGPEDGLYGWFLQTINQFIGSRPVSNFNGAKEKIEEVKLIPRFPYTAATFPGVRLTGYYHDLGKFVADFENEFPYFQIQNPEIALARSPSEEREKLDLTFDIVTVFKSNRAQTPAK
jgi:hypothetical protein